MNTQPLQNKQQGFTAKIYNHTNKAVSARQNSGSLDINISGINKLNREPVVMEKNWHNAPEVTAILLREGIPADFIVKQYKAFKAHWIKCKKIKGHWHEAFATWTRTYWKNANLGK